MTEKYDTLALITNSLRFLGAHIWPIMPNLAHPLAGHGPSCQPHPNWIISSKNQENTMFFNTSWIYGWKTQGFSMFLAQPGSLIFWKSKKIDDFPNETLTFLGQPLRVRLARKVPWYRNGMAGISFPLRCQKPPEMKPNQSRSGPIWTTWSHNRSKRESVANFRARL